MADDRSKPAMPKLGVYFIEYDEFISFISEQEFRDYIANLAPDVALEFYTQGLPFTVH